MQRKHDQAAGVKQDAIEILTDRQEHGIRYVTARGPVTTWTMEQAGDDDPVFPSRPLARSLGYGRERKLHELSRKLFPTEIELSPHSGAKVPATDEKTVYFRMIPSGGGRPIKEYLYSRRQVLKLTMRSETKKADARQNEMVDVLLMVRRVASGGITEARFKILLEEARSGDHKQIQNLREELNQMRVLLASGVIGERIAEIRILLPLRQIALYDAYGLADANTRRLRKRAVERLRHQIQWNRCWRLLPRDRLGDVEGLLDDMLRDAKERAEKRGADRQSRLFG